MFLQPLIKALQGDLSSCSVEIKKQVSECEILKLSKMPLYTADLHKIATAALGTEASLLKALRKDLSACSAEPKK